MNVATWLTVSRLLICPIFFFLYLLYPHFGISLSLLPYFLLVLLALSELSDALDGYLARRYNQVTELGKVLDPMTDSIIRISVFLAFTKPPVELSVIWVFFFFYRDWVISILRTICALRGYALAARPSGKWKAIFQAIAAFTVVFLLIPYSLGHLSGATLQQIANWLIGIVSGYALLSGIDYIYSNWHYIRQSFAISGND